MESRFIADDRADVMDQREDFLRGRFPGFVQYDHGLRWVQLDVPFAVPFQAARLEYKRGRNFYFAAFAAGADRSQSRGLLRQVSFECRFQFFVLVGREDRVLEERPGISLDRLGGERKFFVADRLDRLANLEDRRFGPSLEPFFYIGIGDIPFGYARQRERGEQNDIASFFGRIENTFAVTKTAFFVPQRSKQTALPVEDLDGDQRLFYLLAIGSHILDRERAGLPGNARKVFDPPELALHRKLYNTVPYFAGSNAQLRPGPQVLYVDPSVRNMNDESQKSPIAHQHVASAAQNQDRHGFFFGKGER